MPHDLFRVSPAGRCLGLDRPRRATLARRAAGWRRPGVGASAGLGRPWANVAGRARGRESRSCTGLCKPVCKRTRGASKVARFTGLSIVSPGVPKLNVGSSILLARFVRSVLAGSGFPARAGQRERPRFAPGRSVMLTRLSGRWRAGLAAAGWSRDGRLRLLAPGPAFAGGRPPTHPVIRGLSPLRRREGEDEGLARVHGDEPRLAFDHRGRRAAGAGSTIDWFGMRSLGREAFSPQRHRAHRAGTYAKMGGVSSSPQRGARLPPRVERARGVAPASATRGQRETDRPTPPRRRGHRSRAHRSRRGPPPRGCGGGPGDPSGSGVRPASRRSAAKPSMLGVTQLGGGAERACRPLRTSPSPEQVRPPRSG